MILISEASKEEKCYTGRDQIWYGNFEETVKEFNENKINFLHAIGWFEDERLWSIII